MKRQVLGGERSSTAGGVDEGGLNGRLEARKVVHDGLSMFGSGCGAVPKSGRGSCAQVVVVLWLSQSEDGASESESESLHMESFKSAMKSASIFWNAPAHGPLSLNRSLTFTFLPPQMATHHMPSFSIHSVID